MSELLTSERIVAPSIARQCEDSRERGLRLGWAKDPATGKLTGRWVVESAKTAVIVRLPTAA